MGRCWIFQGNPKTLDILGELRDPKINISHWTIRQHADEVSYGDTAYIWKSAAGEGNAGIYAMAKVISDVILIPPVIGQAYWVNEYEKKTENRAFIKYLKKFPDNPILKTQLTQAPTLKSLVILKDWQHTIYPVTDQQCNALNKIILNR